MVRKQSMFKRLGISLVLVLIVTSISIIPARENEKRIDIFHYPQSEKIASKPTKETCYAFLGAKWNTLPVHYTINPTNTQGLSQEFITSRISAAAETWDSAIRKEIFDNAFSVDTTAQAGVRDGKNTLAFTPYPINALAFASVWMDNGEITEFDILFNANYIWGDADLNQGFVDVQNLATHELGHGLGLADIYSDSCSGVTMYAHSQHGETQKRTLEKADIRGLKRLYR